MFITPAYAQAAGAPGGMDLVIQIVPFVLIFVIMYFLLIRPQQKRVATHRAMVAAVQRGDTVVTGGGLIGKVKSVSETEDEAVIELAKGVEVRVVRSSLADVRQRADAVRPAKAG